VLENEFTAMCDVILDRLAKRLSLNSFSPFCGWVAWIPARNDRRGSGRKKVRQWHRRGQQRITAVVHTPCPRPMAPD